MWPLIRDFFTVKSAAVRGLRIGIVAGGAALTSEVSPLPDEWKWAGLVVSLIGAAITDQRPNNGTNNGG